MSPHSPQQPRISSRKRKMRTNSFCTNFLNTARVRDIPAKIPDIPDSSLRNPRKTNFRGRARSFRPPPLRAEDPTGWSPDPKSYNLCALFSQPEFHSKVMLRTSRRSRHHSNKAQAGEVHFSLSQRHLHLAPATNHGSNLQVTNKAQTARIS